MPLMFMLASVSDYAARLLGMSQEQLGSSLNVTFQQVQKYEKEANRVSASRLWDISQIIDVPISYFFEDMSDDHQTL